VLVVATRFSPSPSPSLSPLFVSHYRVAAYRITPSHIVDPGLASLSYAGCGVGRKYATGHIGKPFCHRPSFHLSCSRVSTCCETWILDTFCVVLPTPQAGRQAGRQTGKQAGRQSGSKTVTLMAGLSPTSLVTRHSPLIHPIRTTVLPLLTVPTLPTFSPFQPSLVIIAF
jgi:hypothetical protein